VYRAPLGEYAVRSLESIEVKDLMQLLGRVTSGKGRH
jgi:hypothetical protein